MYQYRTAAASDAELEKRLKKALKSKDLVSFKRLVKGGVNVNSTQWFNSTLLHEAVQIGSLEFVEVLLQHNAFVDSQNQSLRTPLHIACRGGRIDVATLLLKHGANVNQRTLEDKTPLHVAAWRCKNDIVKLLVNTGADVNVKDKDGWIPIHWALTKNNIEMVDVLLHAGSAIDFTMGKLRLSPFITALQEQNYPLLKVLLSHGALDSLTKQMKHVLVTVLRGSSSLTIQQKLDTVSFLIEQGLVARHAYFMKFSNEFKGKDNDVLINLCSKLNRTISLQNICRNKICEHVKFLPQCYGKSIFSTIVKLPVPDLLKQYILYTDSLSGCLNT